jgi:hypothetical protein
LIYDILHVTCIRDRLYYIYKKNYGSKDYKPIFFLKKSQANLARWEPKPTMCLMCKHAYLQKSFFLNGEINLNLQAIINIYVRGDSLRHI